MELEKRSEAGVTFDDVKARVLRLIDDNPGILRPKIAANIFGSTDDAREQEANERVVRKAVAKLIEENHPIYSPGKGFYYKPSKDVCERAIAIMEKTLKTHWAKAKKLEELTGINFTEQLSLNLIGDANGSVRN